MGNRRGSMRDEFRERTARSGLHVRIYSQHRLSKRIEQRN